jgi:hypothetical protein
MIQARELNQTPSSLRCAASASRSRRTARAAADSGVPLVALTGLPDHHDQPPGRAQRSPDVGERGGGIVEEHGAEPADRQVEALVREAVDLRVGTLEGDVAYILRPG